MPSPQTLGIVLLTLHHVSPCYPFDLNFRSFYFLSMWKLSQKFQANEITEEG